MQHVKTSWLKKFNYSLVGLTAVLYLTYFLFANLHVSERVINTWGVTPLVLVIGTIHAVFVLLSDKTFFKKAPWVTTVISIAIYAFLFGAIIESSGNTNILYRVLFIAFTFFMGMAGLYPPITGIILTWSILVMTVAGILEPTKASLAFNITVDTLLTVSGIAGWRFFKKYYVGSDEELVLTSKLQEEQFKSTTILESITDGVLVVDMNNIIQIANASAAQMLGWTKDEIIDLDYHSLLKPVAEDATTDKAEEEALSIAMQTGESTQKISKLETLNSRQIYVDIVASPIYQNLQNQEGKVEKKLTGIIAVLRDVDKQKRDEQQRSDFISTASHEMRTPVASIQGYLELALNPKISQIDDKTRTYLDKAYEATKHLGQLFQDLLTVSQTEDGRITNHPEVIEVISLLKEVCSGQIQPAARKGLKLECNLHDQNNGERVVTPLMHVKADPERLREVILNLVENAIKYTPEGSITISAELKDDSVVIGVKDTGSGIAEEDIVHLFQKFYRVDNSATREIGGTGLGLYISKQIIEMMDGKIWVESKLGEGSTFFVELPRVEPDQIVEQTNNPTPQPV